MNRKAAAAIAVVAVLVVVCAAYAVMETGGEREYAITYELDGGTQNDANPATYRSDETVELLNPTKEGMYFTGWYLDEDLTERVDSIGPDTTGDIILYAGWTESLEGMGFTLSLDGQVSEMLMGYSIGGTATYRYLYLDESTGEYLMEMDYDYTYDYSFNVYERSGQNTYWTSDSDITWVDGGTEVIDTIDGPVECEIVMGTYSDGSTETQWIGGGWIPYKVEYRSSSVFSQTTITYTLTEHFYFEPDNEIEVAAYADDGITVSGSGTYSPGQTVTLTAEAESGTTFAGWYNSDGNLVSTSRTCTIELSASDVTLFACNTVTDDVTVDGGERYDLCTVEGLDTVRATVVDMNTGETVAVFDDAQPIMTFSEGGEYIVLLDGVTADGEAYHGFYGVLVDGTVERTFIWYSGGEEYSIELDILYSDYVHYRDYYTVEQRQQDVYGGHARDATFVTADDPYVQQIAAYIMEATSGMSVSERLNVALAFTQYIEYQSDDVFMGVEEYWKFPLETLFDQGGDCEDTSILLASITKAMGYDSALLIFSGHMAAGVYADGLTGTYYLVNNRLYYYCETTSTGFSVGEIPTNIDVSRATVVAV